MSLLIEQLQVIYSMYRAVDVLVHRACCERATQPYSLGRGGTIYPGSRPARIPKIVIEYLLTRLMLIKMYVRCIYSRFSAGAILSIRKYEYGFITTVNIEFDDTFQA